MNKEIFPRIYCSVLFMAVAMLLGSTAGLAQTPSTNSDRPAAARMRALNNSLLNLHGQMQGAGPSDVRNLRGQAATVIAERAAALAGLIQNDPHAALKFAFSPELLADMAAKFPRSASQLESHSTVSGPVERWSADYPGLKSSRSWLTIRSGVGNLNLHFAYQEPLDLRRGDVVQASGVVAGSEMAVETSSKVQSAAGLSSTTGPSSASLIAAASSAPARHWPMLVPLLCGIVLSISGSRVDLRRVRRYLVGLFKRSARYGLSFAVFVFSSATSFGQTSSCTSTTGLQNIAVILVTFPGVTLPPNVTVQSLQDTFFNTSTGVSLDGFLRETSYGQTSATGDVFGPYTLTGTYASCGDVTGAVLNDAIVAAAASGANMQSYNRVFLVFPDLFSCGWAGLATNSCSITSSGTTLSTSTAYLVASYLDTRIHGVELASHEIGHNFGLAHSGMITSGTDVLGPVASAGTESDMGDLWSTMGGMDLGMYPAPQKAEVLGWLEPTTNYQVVQSKGTYTLEPLETSPAGLQALKIQRGTGGNEWLWVEYRQPIGNYDSTLFGAQPLYGALVHYEDPGTPTGHTYQPNFTPGTSGFNLLTAGETWVDPYSNLSISVPSGTSSGLTVNVSYGAAPPTCTHANPTMTVSPLNPSIYAGNSASYALSVINNDSSGCSSNTFSLGSTQPSSWPTSFSSTSITLSPGQSAPVTLYKTGPSGTPPGTYAVNASATNSSYVGLGTANVTVMTAPALTVSVAVSGSSFGSRSTVPITATVLNGGTSASGASVTFTLTAPDGSTATQSATTSSSGAATWSYRLGPKSLTGPYSVVALATLSSGSKHSVSTQTATSNTVSFTVQ